MSRWLNAIKSLAPVIVPIVLPGAGPKVMELIIDGIEVAECVSEKRGKDKLKVASNHVKMSTTTSNFTDASLDDAISRVVDAANVVIK